MSGIPLCTEKIGKDRYRCKNLGIEFTATREPVFCSCSEIKDKFRRHAIEGAERFKDSTLLDKGRHYVTALARWAHAGFPTRTQKEIEKLYLICSACEHYDGENCKICGCRVKKNKSMAFRNKAAMATEHCPHKDGDKWAEATHSK